MTAACVCAFDCVSLKWWSALHRWTWSSYWTAPTAWGKEASSGRATTPSDWAGSWTSDRTRFWPFQLLTRLYTLMFICVCYPTMPCSPRGPAEPFLLSLRWQYYTFVRALYRHYGISILRTEHKHFNMMASTSYKWFHPLLFLHQGTLRSSCLLLTSCPMTISYLFVTCYCLLTCFLLLTRYLLLTSCPGACGCGSVWLLPSAGDLSGWLFDHRGTDQTLEEDNLQVHLRFTFVSSFFSLLLFFSSPQSTSQLHFHSCS